MISNLKILHVCKEDKATTFQRRLAFKMLGLNNDIVFTFLLSKKQPAVKKLRNKIIFKFGYYPEYNNENKEILNRVKNKKYDIIFIEKGVSIKPSTLKRVKHLLPLCKIVSYTLDDMMNPNNSSIQYRRSLKFYDFNFTNKKYNVSELHEQGAKNVFYFKNGYCSLVHRPIKLNKEEEEFYNADVSFIGTFEKQRKTTLISLANSGVNIKVWGWGVKHEFKHQNIQFLSKHVYGDEYAKVVSASKINLCFLRKANRDTETTRSVELPACGGFMIAERTQDHLDLFKEATEAEFFDNDLELKEKIFHYLTHETKRIKIAAGGYQKCLSADYSYENQLRTILKKIVTDEK